MTQTHPSDNGQQPSKYDDLHLELPNMKNVSSTGNGEEAFNPANLTEIWARRAHELAKVPPVEAAGQTMKLLIFWLGRERYGIDVANVREIYPLEQLTPVPRTPDFSVGVFSARGRILSVIDLRAYLGLPAGDTPPASSQGKGQTDSAKIIVVTNTDPAAPTAGLEIGILANEVTDVMTIFKEDIEPPLTTHSGIQTEYLQGITSDLLVILNLNSLLSDKRLIVFEEIL